MDTTIVITAAGVIGKRSICHMIRIATIGRVLHVPNKTASKVEILTH